MEPSQITLPFILSSHPGKALESFQTAGSEDKEESRKDLKRGRVDAGQKYNPLDHSTHPFYTDTLVLP